MSRSARAPAAQVLESVEHDLGRRTRSESPPQRERVEYDLAETLHAAPRERAEGWTRSPSRGPRDERRRKSPRPGRAPERDRSETLAHRGTPQRSRQDRLRRREYEYPDGRKSTPRRRPWGAAGSKSPLLTDMSKDEWRRHTDSGRYHRSLPPAPYDGRWHDDAGSGQYRRGDESERELDVERDSARLRAAADSEGDEDLY